MTLRQWIYRNVYLKTRYWKWLRRKVAKRAGYICEARGCKTSGHNLDAHHIVYHPFREWLRLSDLVYLCRHHHDIVHRFQKIRLKRGGSIGGYKR